MNEVEKYTLTVPEQVALFNAAAKSSSCRNVFDIGPFASAVASLERGKLSTVLTESQQESAFQAAVKCCTDNINAGPFNDFVSMLARRVMANVYK